MCIRLRGPVIIMIIFMMLMICNSSAQTNNVKRDGWGESDSMIIQYSDISNCKMASSVFKDIEIGTPLAKIQALSDTPLPEGMYWPEYPQSGGSIIRKVAPFPPSEWGTNFIIRVDGLSHKQYIFYHDKTNIIRIMCMPLQLIKTAPIDSKCIEETNQFYQPQGPWIMK